MNGNERSSEAPFDSTEPNPTSPATLPAETPAVDGPSGVFPRASRQSDLATMRISEPATTRALLDRAELTTARTMRGQIDLSMMRSLNAFTQFPAEKLLHDYAISPAAKALIDYAGSPQARMLRDYVDSPSGGALRDFATSPTARMLQNYRESPGFEALRHFAESPIARELLRHQDFSAALGRTDRWALRISNFDALAGLSANVAEVDRIRSLVNDITGGAAFAGAGVGLATALSETRSKVAVLAGAADVLGFGAGTTVDAYSRLFGDWRTRSDLPGRFWRDLDHRRARYAEADVDMGLIEATPETTVAVTIESGLVSGISEGSASIATFEIGGMSMSIRSTSFKVDAFHAVDQFERTLRRMISVKLSAIAGPKWFKQRVDGGMVVKARGNRAAAVTNGERGADLISYLDLGDLRGVLLRNDNWEGAFGHVFPNRDRLVHDLQTLVALRRPVMHARDLDAVQLLELICVIRRLTQFIDDDGEWRLIADSED